MEAARRTDVLEDALLAQRPAGVADPAAVPDQEMRESSPVGTRYDALEVALDLPRILVSRQAEALRQAADMGIDDDALRVPELGGYHVGRLASDPRQPHELLETPRQPP